MMTMPGFEQETFKNLLEKYQLSFQQGDPLQKVRGKAWDHFLELGLPTRQTEVYRYIKLRQLFSQSYSLAEKTDSSFDEVSSAIYPECRQSVLVFVNGHFASHLSNFKALPSQVIITSLEEATKTYGTFLNNYWAKSIKEEEDPFVALNSALHRQGAFIYIPPKTIVEAPIQIIHLIKSDHQLLMLMPRVNIFVGAHAQVNLIYSQKNQGSTGYFVNQVSDFILEEDAHVQYTQILCDEAPSTWHLDAVRANLKRNATLKTVAFNEGSLTVRNDYRIALTGENAEVLLNGVSMLKDKREAHVNVLVDHQAPYCRSYQLFKGVLDDFSRSSFEGKILVRQAAQKTEAFQLNNNLLLNDYAHADSKPNLEIFADDVKASHGATVGQLDVDQLFYLTTRGIPEQQAKNLLINGFVEQVIDLIPLSSLKESISTRAHHYLIGQSHG